MMGVRGGPKLKHDDYDDDHATNDQRVADGHNRDLLRGPRSYDAAVHNHDREANLDHDSGDGQYSLPRIPQIGSPSGYVRGPHSLDDDL
jgi:hypothetical protein